MNEFWKVSPGVNKLLSSVTDVTRYQTASYRVAEFSWKGGRYRLISTGDLYQLNYCGVPMLIHPFQTVSHKYTYATVGISEQTNSYYVHNRKQYHLKDLVWAVFGDRDVERGQAVYCKDGNHMNCKFENLEVRKRGIS